jgi:hypothetical protein
VNSGERKGIVSKMTPIFLCVIFVLLLTGFVFWQENEKNINDNKNKIIDSAIISNEIFTDWLKEKKLKSSMFINKEVSLTKMNREVSGCDKSLQISLSPDGEKTLCFGSGGEPDSTLILVNKIENKSFELAFCGTPCSYDSGFWLNKDKFVFLWSFNDFEYENNLKPYKQYIISIYDFSRGSAENIKTAHLYGN